MKHFLGGWRPSEIWVPHLRRGLIATKVGHRAKHDPLSLAKTPTRRSRLFTHPPLSPSFPFRERQKINFKKVACFSPPKSHHKSTTFHHASTTISPSKHHHKTRTFPPTPFKNARKSADSRHPTSAKFFSANYRKASCVGTGSASIFSTSSVTSFTRASCAGGFAGPANPA